VTALPLDELRAAVGTEHVLVDADLTASYERDWTGRFGARAGAVVRPADTAQVSAGRPGLRGGVGAGRRCRAATPVSSAARCPPAARCC
jgi:hypothetical protein